MRPGIQRLFDEILVHVPDPDERGGTDASEQRDHRGERLGVHGSMFGVDHEPLESQSLQCIERHGRRRRDPRAEAGISGGVKAALERVLHRLESEGNLASDKPFRERTHPSEGLPLRPLLKVLNP